MAPVVIGGMASSDISPIPVHRQFQPLLDSIFRRKPEQTLRLGYVSQGMPRVAGAKFSIDRF
jgi:hypothetical protein